MRPLEEDFARWRDDPITLMIFDALEKAEDEQKAAWLAASWDGGVARAPELEKLLNELKVRADAYRALREMSFADVSAWLGMEEVSDGE